MINNENFAVTDAASEEELYELVRQIPVPVLLINGGMDELSTMAEVLHIAQLIPGAKLIMYQNMGHSGLHECPEMVAADMDLFMREHEKYVF